MATSAPMEGPVTGKHSIEGGLLVIVTALPNFSGAPTYLFAALMRADQAEKATSMRVRYGENADDSESPHLGERDDCEVVDKEGKTLPVLDYTYHLPEEGEVAGQLEWFPTLLKLAASTARVWRAIMLTKQDMLDYWANILAQRAGFPEGLYPDLTPSQLDERLLAAPWYEIKPAYQVAGENVYFEAEIPGVIKGALDLELLDDDAQIELIESSEGQVLALLNSTAASISGFSTIVIDNDTAVVVTMYPGAPQPIETLSIEGKPRQATVEEAFKMGVKWVIIR